MPQGWSLWVDDSPGTANVPTGGAVTRLIKHPVWISVGTVVGVLALVLSAVAYVQSGPSDSRLSIAALTLGEPVELTAEEWGPTGYPEDRYPMDDVAAAPIDVTFKNDGGTTASIGSVSVTVIRSDYIQSCLRQGAGGVSVAAEYELLIPPSHLGGDSLGEPVSRKIDFTVNPGETGRFVLTVGPEQQADNIAIVAALRLTFVLSDGTTLETDPIIIGTTQDIVDTLVSEVEAADPGDSEIGRLCRTEVQKIEDVVGTDGISTDAVDQLRDAYQKVV
jgi:hypothetical protein